MSKNLESRRYQKTRYLAVRVLNLLKSLVRGVKVPFLRRKYRDLVFDYGNTKLPYCIHKYNSTYNNERCVEIPIFKKIIEKENNILEVGNVLSHYTDVKHDVMDKYEQHEAVNYQEDFCKFNFNNYYDIAISISTLEHIGKNDGNVPDSFLLATEKLKLLADKVVFSVPLRQNTFVDYCLCRDLLVDYDVTYYYQDRFLDWRVTEEPFDTNALVVAICSWSKH